MSHSFWPLARGRTHHRRHAHLRALPSRVISKLASVLCAPPCASSKRWCTRFTCLVAGRGEPNAGMLEHHVNHQSQSTTKSPSPSVSVLPFLARQRIRLCAHKCVFVTSAPQAQTGYIQQHSQAGGQPGGPYRRPTVRAASGSARHAWGGTERSCLRGRRASVIAGVVD